MPHLVPCPACSRHVRSAERCPFCDAEVVASSLPAPAARLGRAAAMAVGAAVTASIAACNTTPPVAAPTDTSMEAGAVSTATATPDAGPQVPDYSNLAKPYGAPPAEGLLA